MTVRARTALLVEGAQPAVPRLRQGEKRRGPVVGPAERGGRCQRGPQVDFSLVMVAQQRGQFPT